MFKKSPLEKEKILQKLTEKEIKDQLYGFNAKPQQAIKQEAVVKKEDQIQQPKERKPKKESKVSKNPYLLIQIALSILFLILIWISLRQIIKAVSNQIKRPIAVEQNIKQKNIQKYKTKLRRR